VATTGNRNIKQADAAEFNDKTLPQILMIDNYDSFTFNLVHYLEQLDAEVTVKRNDEINIDQIVSLNPSHIMISPGPCTPNEAGISMELIKYFQNSIPILGVCLGHQAIGQVFGASITNASKIMHGKTSTIHNNGQGVFSGLPSTFKATRYHSLVIDPGSLSDDFEVTAWTEDDNGEFEAIMGIQHKRYDLQGVQFHPESVLSEFGLPLLSNFIR
jgi:anthranilate synthase component 2